MVAAVGGPLALVQVGLVLLALTGAAVMLRRRIERPTGARARAQGDSADRAARRAHGGSAGAGPGHRDRSVRAPEPARVLAAAREPDRVAKRRERSLAAGALMSEVTGSPTLTLWVVVLGLPLLLTLATAFTKTTVVLGALRVGLGAEAILPAAALFGVALVVTGGRDGPHRGGADRQRRWRTGPGRSGRQGSCRVGRSGRSPPELRDPARLARRGGVLRRAAATTRRRPVGGRPAFLVTELTEALAMAVVILVPLLLVDLIVAQTLMLLGLVNQPPGLVTVPPQDLAVPQRRRLGRRRWWTRGRLRMNELFDLVREALMLAVTLVLPLALAALAGAVVGGLVVVVLGLQDQNIAALVRAASVVVTLILVGGALRDEVVGFTTDQWSTLAARGQQPPALDGPGARVAP